jgi:hypothetical protein
VSEEVEADTTPERDLRREFLLARRRCTPKQRRWLAALPKNDFQYWKAALALGFSRDTVWKWLRQERVSTVLELMREIDELDADVGRHRVIRNWEQQARADLRLFFRKKKEEKNDKGEVIESNAFELIPPHEWTDEMAGMVQELSFDASGQPKLKLYNRQDATLTLAKYNKMILERHEVNLVDAPVPNVTIVERGSTD